MSPESPPENEAPISNPPGETLAESFAQSKRELKFILSTWIVFFLWVVLTCHFLGTIPPGGEIPLLLGMPRWVIAGIAIPWLVATGVAVFFATRVMKDTDLEGGTSGEFKTEN